MNIFHLVEHFTEFTVDYVQVTLLTFVLIAGILLNIAAFEWMKE